MKITLTSITLLISIQLAFSQVPKKIIVEHFTNTNCSICASRNPGFYTNLNNQTGILHLAIHPSSPYPNCLLYQQNATANDARTNYYGIYGSTPRLVINGNVISGGTNYSSSSIFTPYLGLTSPASIRIVQEKFNSDSIRSTIIIKTEAVNTLGALSLFVALAEDSVIYTGGNGEPIHFDVFRKSMTSATGDAVTLPTVAGDSIVFTFISQSNPIWNFSRIATMAILQETISKNLVQAEAVSAASGVTTTSVNELNNNGNNLFTVYPTIIQDFVNIDINKFEDNSEIKIIDILGNIIYKAPLTSSILQLQITNISNGIYFVQVGNKFNSQTKKIIVNK